MSENQTDISISFVIPVLNGEKYMADCLDYIIREMGPQDEIIVVDNGSTDRTLDIVRGYSRATILQFPEVTIAALRNRGAEVATGDVMAFIDSDCLVCEGWRAAVVDVLSDPSIHATGSKCDIPRNNRWIERAWYSKRVRTMRPMNYINSGNLVLRREVFETVGGFDENLVTDEDYDIGERLNQSGCVVMEAPSIRVEHLGNPKSLMNFYRKERWHAASSLRSLKLGSIDKPTLMTIIFLLCGIAALIKLPSVAMGRSSPLGIILLILLVPVVTAGYRGIQYQSIRQFPALAILYFFFYVARATTLLHFLYKLIVSRKQINTSERDAH